MIVALILALVPVSGFVLLLIFSDLGGNEPTLPTSSNRSQGDSSTKENSNAE